MKRTNQMIKTFATLLLMMVMCVGALAQSNITITGTVKDSNGEELIGASVVVKGNTSLGTVTDFNGNFQLSVPSENSVIVVSYVGMVTEQFKVEAKRSFNVTLTENNQLSEVVVVGYGQQKKASVVGAITQTTGQVLERTGGVSDIGSALTGNLPGVITSSSSVVWLLLALSHVFVTVSRL